MPAKKPKNIKNTYLSIRKRHPTKNRQGYGSNSVVDHLPCMHEALDWIPSIHQEKKKRARGERVQRT
jgi:hypothetical protein